MGKGQGLAVVADAAHAMGSRLAGRTVAQWGDAACFSIGRGKLVSGGEGGLLTTNDANLYERALSLTQHPTRIKRELGPGSKGLGAEDLGYNYRMHPLAAVLALADVANLDQRLSHRRNVWRAFHEGLGEVPFLSPPVSQPSEQWTAYGVPLTFRYMKSGIMDRKELVAAAQQQGVPLRCGPVETPLHLRSAFQRSDDVAYWAYRIQSHPSHRPDACPVAEQRCAREELWAMSALDMDGIGGEQAYELGRRLMLCRTTGSNSTI
jgi:perosamine synthetase